MWKILKSSCEVNVILTLQALFKILRTFVALTDIDTKYINRMI